MKQLYIMINQPIKAALFDLDGVLIDSNPVIQEFWSHWAAKEGIAYNNETVARYIYGRTTLETINELFAHSSQERKEQMVQSAKEFDMAMRPGLVNGASLFLKNLSPCLKKIGVVTSTQKGRARQMLALNGIASYICFSVTGDEIRQGKPHPEPYIKGAAKAGVPPGDCLAFEDSDSGILSALSAGMYVIAIGNDKIKDERIICTVKDFSELTVQEGTIQAKNGGLRIGLSNG